MILKGTGIFNGMMFLDHKVTMDLFQMSSESESHHLFLHYFFSSPFFGFTLFFFLFFHLFHLT